jgi:hypothetical protein
MIFHSFLDFGTGWIIQIYILLIPNVLLDAALDILDLYFFLPDVFLCFGL